jgi:hypothetical protein
MVYKKDLANLQSGKNSIALNGLATLSNGAYMIEVPQQGIVIGRTQLWLINKIGCRSYIPTRLADAAGFFWSHALWWRSGRGIHKLNAQQLPVLRDHLFFTFIF